MNVTIVFATATRILKQLRHDHRTLGMIFFVPTLLLIILYFVFNDENVFSRIAPQLLGIIPFTLMFVVSSVAILRERTSGTLERLLVSSATKLDIILGYALAFMILAFIQVLIASFITLNFLNVDIIGSKFDVFLLSILAGICGMAFGLLFSAFAKNEFQAVQFMPAFVLPQFLICGLFVPRESMELLIEYLSNVMPLTYIVDAVGEVSKKPQWTSDLSVDILIIFTFIVSSLLLGSRTLK